MINFMRALTCLNPSRRSDLSSSVNMVLDADVSNAYQIGHTQTVTLIWSHLVVDHAYRINCVSVEKNKSKQFPCPGHPIGVGTA